MVCSRPGSHFIGFASIGKLKKVTSWWPQTVCDLSAFFRGGAGPRTEPSSLVQQPRPSCRFRVSSVPAPLTTLDPPPETTRAAGFLPDGRHFVYERSLLAASMASPPAAGCPAQQQDSRRLATSNAPRYAASADPGSDTCCLDRKAPVGATLRCRRLEPAGAAVPIAETLIHWQHWRSFLFRFCDRRFGISHRYLAETAVNYFGLIAEANNSVSLGHPRRMVTSNYRRTANAPGRSKTSASLGG